MIVSVVVGTAPARSQKDDYPPPGPLVTRHHRVDGNMYLDASADEIPHCLVNADVRASMPTTMTTAARLLQALRERGDIER